MVERSSTLKVRITPDHKVIIEREADMPPSPISLGTTLYNKTGSWRTFRPIYDEKLPSCNHACPAGEKIQSYLNLVLKKDFAEAYKVLTGDNPLPSVCGRVCYHPCETECNRKDYDEAIGIHNIERFIGDFGRKNVRHKPSAEKRAAKVAIVGSGPGGLSCAYQLAKLGYRVTVLEAHGLPGGMLRVGIPDYRLPKDILDDEIKTIEELGVEIKTNVRIGKDIPFSDLRANYQAVFIATGAHKDRLLEVPNEESRGVIPGLEFLSDVNLGQAVNRHTSWRLGKKVAVIGGGNTAMDAARVALRLGAKPVILYRRTKNEMPAIPDEIESARVEGIAFSFLVAPVQVLAKRGQVVGIELLKMRLGEPDSSGRRRPVPVPKSNFRLAFDTIIPAIGEIVDMSFLPEDLKKTGWGIDAGERGLTNLPGIFAGGDCVTGPKTVVEAIGTGKKAAGMIDRFLRGEPLEFKTEDKPVVGFENIVIDYFEPAKRKKMPQIPLKERKKSLGEVNIGYELEDAVSEADRCFSCGICNQCDNCRIFCPDIAITRDDDTYEVAYDYCKGCGICVSECPRDVISLVEEAKKL